MRLSLNGWRADIVKQHISLVLSLSVWAVLVFVPGIRLHSLQAPAARLAATYLNVGVQQDQDSFLISENPPIRVTSTCSGAAFLTLTFLMAIVYTRRSTSCWRGPGALVVAYGSTLLANSIRLSSAPWVKAFSDLCVAHRFHGAVHLFAGLLVYLSAFILLSWFLSRRITHEQDPAHLTT